MRRLVLMLFVLVVGSLAIAGNDQKEHKLLNQALNATSLLNQASTVLMAAGDLLSNNPDLAPSVLEATLARYANQVDGIRSILVLNNQGEILYDTYHKVASRDIPQRLYLGDRDYFKGAFSRREMTLYTPVLGRTSGSLFLPASQAVITDGAVKYVTVAIISPNRLIHPSVIETEYSVVTIFNSKGKLLAKFPDGTDIPDGFYESLEINKNGGNTKIVPFNQNFANSVWVHDKKHEITVIYSIIQFTS